MHGCPKSFHLNRLPGGQFHRIPSLEIALKPTHRGFPGIEVVVILRRFDFATTQFWQMPDIQDCRQMAKTNRKLNKANHGQRPASSKARKQKRKHVKLS
jgi:hypothetical protein